MKQLPYRVLTLGLCAVLVGAFAVSGPTFSTRYMDTLAEVYLGVFRHGSISHLVGNIMVILLGGLFAEQKMGVKNTALLIVGSAFAGTTAQYLVIGPNFIGASSISYGLLAYGVLVDRTKPQLALAAAAIILLMFLEWAYRSSSVAVYAHIFGALVGAYFAMFESLFGSKNPTLKPMQHQHIARVIEIISETDSDDAHEAEDEFLGNGLEGMFVLVQRGEVMGVIGYSFDEQVEDIAWLSWTYLARKYTGAGHGGQMMNDLLGKLNGFGVRKIFIATSDYAHNGKKIYAAAHKLYEDFGAEVELTIPNYHSVGEAKIIYGLENPEFNGGAEFIPSEKEGLVIAGVGAEPEADDVVGIQWEESPVGVAGMDHAIEKAQKKGARMVVFALPSDLSDANAVALETHNFKRCGQLSDYYNPSLHQVWWLCMLSS